MLSKILSKETCGKCRGCCYFDKTDLWEVPLLTPETAKIIEKNYPETKPSKKKSLASFDIPEISGDEMFFCPMLTDKGCILKDNKPFDCKIWPFRIMYDENKNVSVAVSKYCKPVSSMSKEKLKDFLLSSGLIDKIKKYYLEYPKSIKDFSKDYLFIYTI